MRISERDWNKVYAPARESDGTVPPGLNEDVYVKNPATFEQSRFHIGAHKSG